MRRRAARPAGEAGYYDDQSNPATIPGIYTKLLDVDKVDLVVSGYATNMIAPALPIVMGHNRTFLSLFGLAVNSEFNYPKYFSFLPIGGMHPKEEQAAGSSPWRCNKIQATNHGAGWRRRGIPAQRDGWRPGRGQGTRAEDRLRQNLSADDQRLFADRACDPGNPIRILSWLTPILRIAWAWSAPPVKSG